MNSNHDRYCSVMLIYFMHSRSKKIICVNTNYRKEMKMIPIIMDQYLLYFDALKFFLGVRLHGGGSQPNFNFFNINPQIFQRNRKVHLTICLEKNFPGNLRGELYDFVEKFGGFTLNKLRLSRDTPPHVDGPLRKTFKAPN